MPPFRLAHLSDPHLGPLPPVRLRQLLGKRLTGWLNWQRRGRMMGADTLDAIVTDLVNASPDHIVVSGDLTNLALPMEINRAAAWMASLGTPGSVSAVPGNHDAYVPGALAMATEAWTNVMRGERVDGAPYPYLLRVGTSEAPIALIGCSTAEATPPFVAAGPFREDQADRLLTLLGKAEGAFRVVVIHHPPIEGAIVERKAMRGIDRFQAAIRGGGAELILHGHTHLPTRNAFATPNGAVPVVGVAAAGQSPGGHHPAGRWNLFEIDHGTDGWQCTQIERGVDASGAVRELGRHELSIPHRVATAEASM